MLPIVEVQDVNFELAAAVCHDVRHVADDLKYIVDSAILTRRPTIEESAHGSTCAHPFYLRTIKYVKERLATLSGIECLESASMNAIYGATSSDTKTNTGAESIKLGEWRFSATYEDHRSAREVQRKSRAIIEQLAVVFKYSRDLVVVDPFFRVNDAYYEFWQSILALGPLCRPRLRIVRKEHDKEGRYDDQHVEHEYRPIWDMMKTVLSQLEIVTVNSIHDRHLIGDRHSFDLSNGFESYSGRHSQQTLKITPATYEVHQEYCRKYKELVGIRHPGIVRFPSSP